METRKIKISEIEMNDDRNEGGKGDIESLARNLEKFGQINAVTVVKASADSDFTFRIIAGRRRVTAAKSLGWEEIRADVYDFGEITEGSEEMIALSENAAREEMNAIDEGILYANELKKGTPVEELAALFCRNKKTVYQRSKLASLIPEMRELYKAEKIPLHLAAMAAELPPEAQMKCIEKSNEKTWGPISEWEIKTIVSEVSNDYVEKLGGCTLCGNCKKRTRYSDKTLFPELAETCDRCLDHDCFMVQLKKFIEKQLEIFRIENPEADTSRLVTTEVLPENLALEFSLKDLSDSEAFVEDYNDEDLRNALEAGGKIKTLPCWSGKQFISSEVAPLAAINAFYKSNDNGSDEKPEWEKARQREIRDICRNVPEEKLNAILEDAPAWWESKRKINDGFEARLKASVLEENDDKFLDKELIALAILLFCDIAEIKDLPGLDKDIKLRSFDEFEKLMKVNRGLLLRTMVKSLLSGYRAKPVLNELEASEWQKIFECLDIDLVQLRDESIAETYGIEIKKPEKAEKSDENFDEDIEKFGVFEDDEQ